MKNMDIEDILIVIYKKLKKILNKDQMKIYNIGGLNTFKYHFNFLINNNFKNFRMSKYLKHNIDFEDSFKLLKFLVSDKLKSFPVFYAIEL